MSRRTIISYAASVFVGIACLATISTDALAYRPALGELAWAALAFITVAPIAAVFTVAQPYAAEWR